MKVEIEGNYVDPETVENIIQVKAETNSVEEGGAFSFKPDTEIILKSGDRIRTPLSTKEVHDLLYPPEPEGVSNIADPSPGSSVTSASIDNTDNMDLGDAVKLGEDLLKELHKIAENTHTISEMLTRLTIHITDGNDIRVRQV